MYCCLPYLLVLQPLKNVLVKGGLTTFDTKDNNTTSFSPFPFFIEQSRTGLRQVGQEGVTKAILQYRNVPLNKLEHTGPCPQFNYMAYNIKKGLGSYKKYKIC